MKKRIAALLVVLVSLACPGSKWHVDRGLKVTFECTVLDDSVSLNGATVALVHSLDSTGKTSWVDCGELNRDGHLSGVIYLGWGETATKEEAETPRPLLVTLEVTRTDGEIREVTIDLRQSMDEKGQVYLRESIITGARSDDSDD